MKFAPYSFSKIDTYQKCPRKFFYHYIIKKPITTIQDTTALTFGDAVHSNIEMKLRNFKNLDKEIYTSKVGSVTNENYSYDRFKQFTDKAIDIYNEIKNSLKTYSDAPFHEIIEFKWALNKRYESIEFDNKEAILRGFMDLVFINDENIFIIDWKTGKNYAPKEQLEFYALAIDCFHKFRKIYCVNIYLERDNKLSWNCINDIDTVQEKFNNIIHIIENDTIYLCKPTKLCDWCQYKEGCAEEEKNDSINFVKGLLDDIDKT